MFIALKKMREEKKRYKELKAKEEFENAIEYTKTNPFWHYCDGCGKKELLTSKQAYEDGWDAPGPDSMYQHAPNYGFGMVMIPRVCGKCGITSSIYWKISHGEELTEADHKAIERIEKEPMSLLVEE